MIFHKNLLTIIKYCVRLKAYEVLYMIGKKLDELLTIRNSNPNKLAKEIGISAQTIYSIIERDNMKIDFGVLLKICEALDVSVEYFYADYYDVNKNSPSQSDELKTEFDRLFYMLSQNEKEYVINNMKSIINLRHHEG